MSGHEAPVALLCPGQGAQRPGFARPWMRLPGFSRRLGELSEAAGVDLAWLGTEADAGTLQDTAVAQPLIVGAGLAAAAVLAEDERLAHLLPPAGPDQTHQTDQTTPVLAGHSVGEVTAAALAGVLSGDQAMEFVAERGRAMARAAAVAETGMSAVLGGEAEQVLAALAAHGLVAANLNGAGQVVAAGSRQALAAIAADPPGAARVRPLRVAGAFHTRHMGPAAEDLTQAVATLTVADPRVPLLSNADGRVISQGQQVLQRLVSQVSHQVRWDLCMQTLGELGVRTVVELPPAGALGGLVQRALPGVRVITLKTPEDLSEAADSRL